MNPLRQITFDPVRGYPANSRLVYVCLACNAMIPSLPEEYVACACGNICVDVDGGRMTVNDHASIALYERTPDIQSENT